MYFSSGRLVRDATVIGPRSVSHTYSVGTITVPAFFVRATRSCTAGVVHRLVQAAEVFGVEVDVIDRRLAHLQHVRQSDQRRHVTGEREADLLGGLRHAVVVLESTDRASP